VDPVLGSLVYQLPRGVTLAYDLRLGRTIARWKGIVEEIHFGGIIRALSIIENLNPKKPSFRPSKWPRKLKTAKNSKFPKLPETCFEPVGKGGLATDIVRQHRYSNRGRTPSVTTHITRSKINTPMFSRGKTPTGKHPRPQPTRPLGAVY
jgi:hypothetical protein